MKEKTKINLGGLWVVILTIISVWLLSLFKDASTYHLVTLVWAFAWLGGLQFSSYCKWVREFKENKRKVKKELKK